MVTCPYGKRNAPENGLEEEIHRHFVVFHQNIRSTNNIGLSTNERFNLWHGLVYFSKLDTFRLRSYFQLPVCVELQLNDF